MCTLSNGILYTWCKVGKILFFVCNDDNGPVTDQTNLVLSVPVHCLKQASLLVEPCCVKRVTSLRTAMQAGLKHDQQQLTSMVCLAKLINLSRARVMPRLGT